MECFRTDSSKYGGVEEDQAEITLKSLSLVQEPPGRVPSRKARSESDAAGILISVS